MEGIEQRERALAGPARGRYFDDLEKELKDPDTYNVLVWVFGGLGIHRFYLGHVGHGMLHLFALPAGVILLILGLAEPVDQELVMGGAFFIVLDFILWFRDVFRYRTIVGEYNNEIRLRLLELHERDS